MRNRLSVRSTRLSFSMLMGAFALLYCVFNISPSFAQNLDWRYHGNTQSNERFQDVDQINPSNVARLKPAWIFHTGVLGDPNMALEMTPLVVNGVMYVPTGDDDVFALDAATGEQIWAYHPTDMPKPSTLPICCNNDNRGVAYNNGRIFVARLDAKLVALNAHTGKVMWKSTVDSPSNGASMTIAPQIVEDKVVVGVSGAEFAVRGHVDAYDQQTGALVWRFWTTEPTTWGGNTYLTGGASVWGNPSYDPQLHTVYFSTGNAYPWPSPCAFFGVVPVGCPGNGREGKNLYSTSIVAVDASTGQLKWYFQFAHHDMWDFDGPQPTVLFDWNGTPAIEHTSKTGYMFILDRRTGQSLLPYSEVPVPTLPAWESPWPTQPVSSIESLTEHSAEPCISIVAGCLPLPPGFTAAPQWSPYQPEALVFQPWAGGGMEWPPAAYSPRTHFIYSHANYSPVNLGVDEANNIAFAAIPGEVDHGVYGAVDTRTGKVAWKIPITGTTPNSGMGVAGDLVFFGESNGLFHAADARTGKILWTFDASKVKNAGGANASPAFYVVDGKEYVVYAFGGEPGNSPVLGDAVIAFALPENNNSQ
jgi:quinohemoprotein ethanol dehydrogenase